MALSLEPGTRRASPAPPSHLVSQDLPDRDGTPENGRERTPSTRADDSLARMRPSRFTLTFPQPLEREYRDAFTRQSLPAVRWGLALCLMLYALFGILDAIIAPGQTRSLWTIRFVIVGPVLALCVYLTWKPYFARYREPFVGASMVIAVAGIIAMTMIIPSPGNYLYYAGLVLAVMAYTTLVRLRFVTATLLAVVELGAYLFGAVFITDTPPAVLVNNIFFLTSACILGLSACYALEIRARIAFVQQRVIVERRRELEEANALLVRRNAELARSRQQVLRSTHRADLVFLALTDALRGTVLDDKYRIEEKLGSGSFGTVYRGTHLQLGTSVAIKVLRPCYGEGDRAALERLRQEGISAWKLRHPNIVSVMDFSVALESVPYLVMELLVGHSLADEMQRSVRVPVDRATEIMEPVASALAEAHANGVIHRDVKPSNVFLHRGSAGDVVKVIDFGIAKVVDDELMPAADRTTTGLFFGTPAYIAPERLEGAAYDGTVDVYAAGVTLYEMLSGRLPFEMRTGDWSSALARLTQSPKPLRLLVPDIPMELEHLVLRALSRDPAERPPSSELRDVLGTLRGGQFAGMVS